MRLSVIGTGYLGAVHAACMADIGHDVLGVDIDGPKIEALAEGRTPFYEPGLREVLHRGLSSGRLRFTTSTAEAADFGDVHFVCVGTPQQPGSQAADLRYVEAAVDALAPHLRRGALVVGKSTVPVGTATRLADRIAAALPAGSPVPDVAWNPEFLREGYAVQDTLRPDRLVVGTSTERAEALLRQAYAPMLEEGVPYIVTDLATAELVKMAANSFLATKISFINAMAEVCDAAGADVAALADAIGHDSRIGRRSLNAGLGFGGGCLPKDIRAFQARAQELGVHRTLDFLTEVDRINLRQRRRTVALTADLVGGSLAGRAVAVLGAAFKPCSDDIRDSPALAVATALHAAGARVRVHDPEALENARAAHPELDYAFESDKACAGADVVLHLTEWPEYRDISPEDLAAMVRCPRLLDARNTLDAARWRAAGWEVVGLGRLSLGVPRQEALAQASLSVG